MREKNFWEKKEIIEISKKFGTPFYLYDEKTILNNIENLKSLIENSNFRINYATKANSNLQLLKIINEQGLRCDATGIDEVMINLKAGIAQKEIYVVANNLTSRELKEIMAKEIIISLDSIDQIELLGNIAPNYSKVMIRLNPPFGAGANAQVITGGKETKFGIDYTNVDEALTKLKEYNLQLIGVNQHIGSAYLDEDKLIAGVESLLNFIRGSNLPSLEIINFGGGFGLNYERSLNDIEMNFTKLKTKINKTLENFRKTYENSDVIFEFEPGRYVVASASILVGEVTSRKERDDKVIVGTNLGFNNFIRPTLYNSYHEIVFLTENQKKAIIDITGNVCESGDYVGRKRMLSVPNLEELVVVYDTGAYGYSLASNYNGRPKPIELLKTKDGKIIKIG